MSTPNEFERDKGFTRPYRDSYQHVSCGTVTRMGYSKAARHARDPDLFGGVYCVACMGYYPIGKAGVFVWVENDVPTDIKVGT